MKYHLFKKYRVFYVHSEIILQLIRDHQKYFLKNLQHSFQMLEATKRNTNVSNSQTLVTCDFDRL